MRRHNNVELIMMIRYEHIPTDKKQKIYIKSSSRVNVPTYLYGRALEFVIALLPDHIRDVKGEE